jgi:hypothetical protein
MRKSVLLAPLVAAGLIAGPAATGFAHHSVQNQFNVNETISKRGILKKVDWQNPHAWFHFTEIGADGKPVIDKDGREVVWSLETTGPNGLRQLGIADRRVFPLGEVYSFSGYPDRTGATKAFMLQIKAPDGKTMTLGFGFDVPPPAL